MSGRSILLGVLIPFVVLCALALWLTRPTPPSSAPEPDASTGLPTPSSPAPARTAPPQPSPVAPPSPPGGTPPSPPPSRTFGEGSTLPSRSPPPPPVTIPEAEPRQETSTGTVDKEDVRRAIQTVVPLMRQCFQDVAERYAGPQSVTLRFTLEGQGLTGHFRDGEVVETTIQDPFALSCFLDSLLDVRFPAPRGGGRVTITYPFRFIPGADAGR
ncbi:AgmX/PglI C-terminal domain-containing protein [Hyalangium gracile]|uniref:AgmX/PglI C-terminal domain-containing protein n=1 Tax=Hyalangium gracile TaxID=394092 RepID=UPI001CC906B4|nr:AgmX/PglI C-terminal domain-containing protein [Hyalangium gracile]